MRYETVDPEHQSEGDNKEGLYFGRDLPADCEEARKPMHGPDQWPDAVVLPDFKPVVAAYFDAARAHAVLSSPAPQRQHRSNVHVCCATRSATRLRVTSDGPFHSV